MSWFHFNSVGMINGIYCKNTTNTVFVIVGQPYTAGLTNMLLHSVCGAEVLGLAFIV